MTKREHFTKLLSINEVASDPTLVEFINHELELLDKKNTQRKPSKASIENANKREFIVSLLTADPMTLSDIQEKGGDTLAEMSRASIAAFLRTDERVKRTEIKRLSYYYLG